MTTEISSLFSLVSALHSCQLLYTVIHKVSCSHTNPILPRTKLKLLGISSEIFYHMTLLTSNLIFRPFPIWVSSDHMKQLKMTWMYSCFSYFVLPCFCKCSFLFSKWPSSLPIGKTHSSIFISKVTSTVTHSQRLHHFIFWAISIPWTYYSWFLLIIP